VAARLECGAHVATVATRCRIAEGFGGRLDIGFHEHEHAHADGTRHTHAHRHDDVEHMHHHEEA